MEIYKHISIFMTTELQYYLDKLDTEEYRIISRSVRSRKTLLNELISVTSFLDNSTTVTEKLYCAKYNVAPVNCPYCESVTKFRSSTKGYMKTCGEKSCVHKAQQNSIKSSNKPHHFSTEEFKQKHKNSMMEKYGSTNYFSSDIGKQYIRESMQMKHGYDNPARVPSIKLKITESRYKNAIDNYSTILSKNNEKIIEIISTNVKTFCDDCNNESELSISFFRIRCNNNEKCCRKCNPSLSNNSREELELGEFINSIDDTVSYNSRLYNFEIDVYSSKYNVGFEFNGSYWHNELYKDSNYHINKSLVCKNNGTKLYHVWQDDWSNHKEIVKSRIRAIFGEYDKTIYARKTKIDYVDSKCSRKFFNDNHLQGYVNGKTVGLFHENELVCAIMIGKSRFKKETELLRYASKINIRVIGGLEKLLSFYKKEFSDDLITYCDNSWGDGKFYDSKGFYFLHDTPPGFHYVENGIRKNRFNYQKHKLIKEGFDKNMTAHDIMLQKKIYRIYNCGVSKWKLKR